MQCISKGKAHKRYEFGQKVAVASTNRGNWMVAARMLPDNPYDGHTLAETLSAVQAVTGVAVTDVRRMADRQGLSRAWLHPSGERPSARTTKRRLTGGAEAP